MGKPFKAACDLVEKLERSLRSIAQTEGNTMSKQIAKDALACKEPKRDDNDI